MYYDKWWKRHQSNLNAGLSVSDVVEDDDDDEVISLGHGCDGHGARRTLDQKALASALGVSNIGGVFVVLLCGLAVAVIVAVVEFCWRGARATSLRSGNSGLFRPSLCDDLVWVSDCCRSSPRLEQNEQMEADDCV
jgi:hypothetical protein